MSTNTALEAATFRRLLEHLDNHKEVQNIDLMILANFCRNCLSKWYMTAAVEQGLDINYEQAREIIYGMPYSEWKDKYQLPASEEQLQAMAERKKAIDRDINTHWEEVERQKMNEYDEKMRAKLEQEYKLKQANAKDISEQLENFKLNFIKSLKEEMLEGELIKRQVEEDLEREKQREIMRQQKVAQMRADLAEANDQLMRMKEAERLKEIEEEKKIEQFAEKREKLENMKKEREDQRFKNKQETRQRMIDTQIEQLRALKDNQEEVLNRQVAEAEDRANRLYEQQEQRKAEMKAAIERSRQLQIKRKQAQKASEKQEEKDFAEFWKVRNEEL